MKDTICCIIGNVGSCVFGTLPIIETKNLDNSASAAHILNT